MNKVQAQAMFRSKLSSQIKRTDIKRTTLSKLTGANVGQINRWLDGSLMPTYHQFQRIQEVFGVDDEYLIGSSTSERSYEKQFK